MKNIITLTNDNFEEEVLKSNIPVFVDFWASWCGPCKMVAPVVEELANDFDGKAKICKVNVDDEGELSMKFKVMSIPTIIVFKDGQIVEKTAGVRAKEEFAKMIEKVL